MIGNTILELGARAVNAVPYVPPVSPASPEYLVPGTELRQLSVYRYPLQVMGEQILVETPLVGRHQLRNVALAIAAAVELNRAGVQRHHREEHRERHPRDPLAGAVSSHCGAARVGRRW